MLSHLRRAKFVPAQIFVNLPELAVEFIQINEHAIDFVPAELLGRLDPVCAALLRPC